MEDFTKSFEDLYFSQIFKSRFAKRSPPFFAGSFRAFGKEPDSTSLESVAIRLGFETAYPLILLENRMEFYRARLVQAEKWQASPRFPLVFEPRTEGPQKLVSPGAMDLILVPGQIFDRDGGRKGRGKGFYDRYLARAPQAVKIGVLKSENQIQSNSLTLHSWDIKMDFLLLPDRWLKVR